MDTTAKMEVVLFEPDLLFSSRVEGIARRLNIPLRVVISRTELLRELDASGMKRLIISLDSLEPELSDLAKHLKRAKRAVGYYSHVRARLADEARKVGLQTVVSRGVFVSRIQEILREISTSEDSGLSG